MQTVYELARVIADVISAHCPGTTARERFVRACLGGHWYEAKSMVDRRNACRALAFEGLPRIPAS